MSVERCSLDRLRCVLWVRATHGFFPPNIFQICAFFLPPPSGTLQLDWKKIAHRKYFEILPL